MQTVLQGQFETVTTVTVTQILPPLKKRENKIKVLLREQINRKTLFQLTTTWQQWLAVAGNLHQYCKTERFKKRKSVSDHKKKQKNKTSVTYKVCRQSLQNVVWVNHLWFRRTFSAIGKKSIPINTPCLNMCSHTSAAPPAVSVDQSQPLH